MKRFSQLLLIAVFFLSGFFLFAPPVSAQVNSLCPKGGNFNNLCNLKVNNAGGIVGTIIQTLLIIAILMSLFFILYGGIRWISSGGDKGKIDQARGTLVAAIVGLIISLLAFFILNIILGVFTGHGLMNFTIPTLV